MLGMELRMFACHRLQLISHFRLIRNAIFDIFQASLLHTKLYISTIYSISLFILFDT